MEREKDEESKREREKRERERKRGKRREKIWAKCQNCNPLKGKHLVLKVCV